MRYKFYLYKSTKPRSYLEQCIDERFRSRGDAESFKDLPGFDMQRICSELCLMGIVIPDDPIKNILYVSVDDDKVFKAMDKMKEIALREGLVIYDMTDEHSFCFEDLDRALILRRQRETKIRELLFKSKNNIWRIHNVFTNDYTKESAFVITLAVIKGKTKEQRLWDIHNTLRLMLNGGEILSAEENGFVIKGQGYSIMYAVEGYKKHVYWRGSIAQKRNVLTPCIRPIGRMSTEIAYKYYKGHRKHENKVIKSMMYFSEMQERYPDPADRLAAAVRIDKYLHSLPFDVEYSRTGYYSSEMLFYLDVSSYPDHFDFREFSILKIEEESASFILPFIEEICPYMYDRYYTETHFPVQLWDKIIEQLERAKETILYNTDSPWLKPHIERFNLFLIAKNEEEEALIKTDRVAFVRKKRHDIVHLMNILIQWTKEQEIHSYDYRDNFTFCIKGP